MPHDLSHSAAHAGFDFVHDLHGLDDANDRSWIHTVAYFDKRGLIGARAGIESTDHRRSDEQACRRCVLSTDSASTRAVERSFILKGSFYLSRRTGSHDDSSSALFQVELEVPFFINEFMELARFQRLHEMFDFAKFHG